MVNYRIGASEGRRSQSYLPVVRPVVGLGLQRVVREGVFIVSIPGNLEGLLDGVRPRRVGMVCHVPGGARARLVLPGMRARARLGSKPGDSHKADRRKVHGASSASPAQDFILHGDPVTGERKGGGGGGRVERNGDGEQQGRTVQSAGTGSGYIIVPCGRTRLPKPGMGLLGVCRVEARL